MPVVLVVLIKLVVEGIRAFARQPRSAKPEPLCAGCSFAHIQYGANGRRTISCTYGGTVRSMTLDVLYCTDYSDRNVQHRSKRIGFVPEIGSACS